MSEETVEKRRPAMLAALVLAWVFWGFMLLCFPLDLVAASLSETPADQSGSDDLSTIIVVSILTLALSFLARWFFCRFLIHKKRFPSTSSGAPWIFVLGVFVIYGLARIPEAYGLTLFFIDRSYPVYLAFAAPSLAALIVHMPCFLDPTRPHRF